MKLTRPELDYFPEVGAILDVAGKLAKAGVTLHFDTRGIRVTPPHEKAVQQEYYHTAAELQSYLLGLEDGFWTGRDTQKAIFISKD